MKNVIKLAKLNNIFQNSFNKILSQQLNHDRSYMCQMIHFVFDRNDCGKKKRENAEVTIIFSFFTKKPFFPKADKT